jgi:hypothetical protein
MYLLAGAGMTKFVITEVGHHQWLVFADRQSINFCADENEAVKAMTEHSARNRRSRSLRTIRQNKVRRVKQRLEFTPVLDFPLTFCPGCSFLHSSPWRPH